MSPVKTAKYPGKRSETSVNIRIIGGLLSAHFLSYRAGINEEQGWTCNGPLLELAENVAKRLIAAFDTASDMPYGTVNLQHGVPHNETTVTCTAGVGTFILEFKTLSRLTRDPMFVESYYQDNPRDSHCLRHDKPLHTVKIQPHLANVPDYIVPQSLRHSQLARTHKMKNYNNSNKAVAKRRFESRAKDPLISLDVLDLNKKFKSKK